MTGREQYINNVKKSPAKQGKKFLLAYLEERKALTPRQAILAHCYGCLGFYRDGAEDCMNDICPLRLYMPYSSIRIKSQANNPNGNTKTLVRARIVKVEHVTENPDDYDDGQEKESA